MLTVLMGNTWAMEMGGRQKLCQAPSLAEEGDSGKIFF